jgi:hypothetical protein
MAHIGAADAGGAAAAALDICVDFILFFLE